MAHGTFYFLALAKKALAGNATAAAIFEPLNNLPQADEKPLDVNGWQDLKKTIAVVDAIWAKLAEALSDVDYDAPVEVKFYGGNPPAVPLGFFLANLASHNIHHRGQLSQIFDSLKIDNDYSGIKPSFLK